MIHGRKNIKKDQKINRNYEITQSNMAHRTSTIVTHKQDIVVYCTQKIFSNHIQNNMEHCIQGITQNCGTLYAK